MRTSRMFMGLVCVGVITGAAIQRRHLGGLRAEHQRLVAQVESSSHDLSPAPTQAPQARQRNTQRPSLELLQLRGQVGQLMARQRELAGAVAENAKLRQQLATRGTTPMLLPPGYVRKSEARKIGHSSPEDTMQTFLWSLQNRDFQSLLQTLSPEAVETIPRQVKEAGSEEEFFNDAAAFIGFRILDRQQPEDGSVILKVEIVPGQPFNEDLRFRLINGQWKLDLF